MESAGVLLFDLSAVVATLLLRVSQSLFRVGVLRATTSCEVRRSFIWRLSDRCYRAFVSSFSVWEFVE